MPVSLVSVQPKPEMPEWRSEERAAMLTDFERQRVMVIVNAVSEASNVPTADILGNSRKKFPARARQVAMLLCREQTDFSYSVLGLAWDRDHSTVVSAVEKAKHMTSRDSAWTYIYERAWAVLREAED